MQHSTVYLQNQMLLYFFRVFAVSQLVWCQASIMRTRRERGNRVKFSNLEQTSDSYKIQGTSHLIMQPNLRRISTYLCRHIPENNLKIEEWAHTRKANSQTTYCISTDHTMAATKSKLFCCNNRTRKKRWKRNKRRQNVQMCFQPR